MKQKSTKASAPIDRNVFFSKVADEIVHQVNKHAINARSLVAQYLDKNLEEIVMMGLGVNKDRWSSSRYDLEKCNGYAGTLITYLRDLAHDEANKYAPAIAKRLIETRLEEAIKWGLGDAAGREYAEAYGQQLRSRIKEEMDKSLTPVQLSFEQLQGEMKVRFTNVTDELLKGLLNSIKGNADE